jgi:hypothetical protein
LIGPRKQGAGEFSGMDLSLSATAPEPSTSLLDQGGNHEVHGRWRTRRGFLRAYDSVESKINGVATWVAANGLTACLISSQVGYYGCSSAPYPAGGYGVGGYGTQSYGS